MIFRASGFQYRFPRPAIVMGVINVTPDSFSDGGKYVDAGAAEEHALRLIEQGAEILDVGGESTRPGAEPVSEEEEKRRVLPVLKRLAGRVKVPVSIDTQKPGVARAALGVGASIVNDIASNRSDPEMWRIVAEGGAGYVAMHMQGTPRTMQDNPRYGDVVEEVGQFFKERLGRLAEVGVTGECVVLDVGIGFGKRVEHNLQLLGGLDRFKDLERPLLLGVSRKSFIGKVLGLEGESRVPGGLACACWAVQHGVQLIRTHDVAETVQAVRMTERIVEELM